MRHFGSFDCDSRPDRDRARHSSSSFLLDPQLRVEHEDEMRGRARCNLPSSRRPLGILAAVMLMVALGPMLFTGCESTGGSVSGGVYYGTGFYDPWYYGGYYYDDPDIIVTPPPTRPEPPPRPTHPIAPTPSPRPTPLPSIPSAPRASFRR